MFVTRDKLEHLGLPARLVEYYVSQNPYFDEQLFPVKGEGEEGKGQGGSDADTRSAGSRNSLQLDTSNLGGLGQPLH